MRSQSIVGLTRSDSTRPKGDFYPTSPGATLALLGAERFDSSEIWEPACGNGAISKVLMDRGYIVHSTDLYNRGFGQSGLNFFSFQKSLADTVITNPPFNLAEEWIKHSRRLGVVKLALLLKLAFLQGQGRSHLLKSSLSRVLVFTNRLKLVRNGETLKGGGMIPFAWFIFDSTYLGSPTIDWITETRCLDSVGLFSDNSD